MLATFSVGISHSRDGAMHVLVTSVIGELLTNKLEYVSVSGHMSYNHGTTKWLVKSEGVGLLLQNN